MTVESLTLSAVDFYELASGRGGPEAIALLRTGQLIRRRLFLRSLLHRARTGAKAAFAAAGLDESYDLLADVETVDADAVAAVLLAPGVGVWLAGCLSRLDGLGSTVLVEHREDVLTADLSYLANVAAAAAVRARHACTVPVRARDGAVLLPTLGCAQVAPPGLGSWQAATVEIGPTDARVTCGDESVRLPTDRRSDGPGWQGLRQLVAIAGDRRFAVDIDDLGTSLGAGETQCGRLTIEEVASWQQRFADAVTILAADHGDQLMAIAACLRSIIPLRRGARNGSMSVTSQLAFGALGASLRDTAEELAETLIHELAHAKLYALHDLIPLYSDVSGALHRSPWRRDPRPTSGLMHGAYAFLAVCDFHRRQGLRDRGRRQLSGFEFTLRRCEVAEAIEALLGAEGLTVHGVALAEQMQASLAAWTACGDAESSTLATQAVNYQRIRWRLHNVSPDPDEIRRLADAWVSSAASPIPVEELGETIDVGERGGGWNTLAHLMRLRLEHPEKFALVTPDSTLLVAEVTEASTATAGDIALVRGEHSMAAKLYRQQLSEDPHAPEHWAGLALALAEPGDESAGRTLTNRPEVVRATSEQISRTGASAPDPERLAGWLGDADSRKADMAIGSPTASRTTRARKTQPH